MSTETETKNETVPEAKVEVKTDTKTADTAVIDGKDSKLSGKEIEQTSADYYFDSYSHFGVFC